MTHVLSERLEKIWDAYLQADEEAHSELLAEDYRAVHPDGTVRIGKPSAKEIASAPIEDYWLMELEAWPVGEEEAILTYTAEVEVRSGLSAKRIRFAVGEVWMEHDGHWKCQDYRGTVLK